MEESPNYYGILPADVRYSKKICSSAKLLYTELTALTSKEGYCFANNSYFAELYGVSEKSISNWVRELDMAGFIRSEITKNSSGTYRKIFLTDRINVPTGKKKSSNGGEKKSSNGSEENFHTKEYYNNNTININNTNIKESKKNFTLVFPPEFSPNLIQKINDFFEYRKEIKKPFKSDKSINIRIKQFSDELAQFGEEVVIASIDNSIANGWQGTFINKELLSKFSNNKQILKDDKGNYADTQAGRELFITDIREGVKRRLEARRNGETNNFGF
jgi:hypothetical protein